MKVLQILPTLNVGGVERGVIDLVRAMKRKGYESVVVSSGGPLVMELKKMGISHYDLPVHKKTLASLLLVPRLVEIIKKEHVDIVHARSRVPAWIAWFAARKAGVPFLTTCHGYYSVHVLSRIMGWGKKVIAISRVIGRHMIDDFGVPADRIRLIHRGVDVSQFRFRPVAEDPAKGISSRPFRIINVGRFSPIKGQVEFLKAVHILHSQIPVEVWLVGSEGKNKHKYTDLIQQTIRQLGLESCVKLLGTRRDIPELLAESDLLVLSTLVPEAFGRVLIEAGAVGTPVVATRVGGVLDVIDHGENGLLVPPGDVESMGQAMADLLRHRDQARLFAARLREKVEKEFTLESMVEKTLAVYSEVRAHKKILIVKLGAMGDLILCVPSFRMIRKRFPQATIALLTDKKIAPLMSSSPYLDEIITLDRAKLSRVGYLLRLTKKIRKEGYDISVDFQNTKWTHLLAFLSGIGERYGFCRGKFGFLINRPDHTFDMTETPVRHQFRILSKLGVRELDEHLELWPDAASEKKVGEILKENGMEQVPRRVGLVIGSSPNWPTKRWPVENFLELAGRLIEESGCRVVLIGSREDEALVQGFDLGAKEGILNLIGKTSQNDLISLIQHMDVIVTGDTAPLHVAGAMHTKIVALFGPTDPKRHMPPAGGAVVIHRSISCQPCYAGICRHQDKLACLKQISVQEVFDAVQRHLSPCQIRIQG